MVYKALLSLLGTEISTYKLH